VGWVLALLGLGLVHLEVVLLVPVLVILLLRSVRRLSAIAFRAGLLGVRLALRIWSDAVRLYLSVCGTHSPMERSGALEGCG
jgi:hypothetical protein